MSTVTPSEMERQMTNPAKNALPAPGSGAVTGAGQSRVELQRVRESFSRQGLVGTLGAWLVDLEAGRAAIEIPYSHRVAGQSGRFHAAVVAGVAQACGGTAAATLAAANCDIMPSGFTLDYDGAAEGDLLRADGHAVAVSATTWRVHIAVTCRRGDVLVRCASADLSFKVRPPR